MHRLQFARNAIRILGALTSERSHEHAVGAKKSAQINRLHQLVHVLAHVGVRNSSPMACCMVNDACFMWG